MAHLILIALRGLLLICTIKSSTNALEIKGHLPDISVIGNLLENFVKPYMQSIFANRKPTMRASRHHENNHIRDDETIDRIIEETIDELIPRLQDNDDQVKTVDNLTLEGNDDETTIIEFLPNIGRTGDIGMGGGTGGDGEGAKIIKKDAKPDPFKTNIKKYKKMRNKIKKMLHKENVSNNTKYTVLNTLDDIIAQLIENQCNWKAVDRADSPAFRNHKLQNSISRVRSLSDDQWTEMKRQYEGFLQEKLMEEDSFLDMFHDFFSKVVNDSQSLSKRYKIRCQLIEVDKDERPSKPRINALSDNNQVIDVEKDQSIEKDDRPVEPRFNTFNDPNKCDNFKICSVELKELMTEFYRHLNDTSVSVYKNYAAMYDRDVNMEIDLDKDLVVTLVSKIGDMAVQKVAKVFKKQTKSIELDENKDKSANIKHLTNYIKSTVEHVKKHVKKLTDTELSPLRTKLYLSVKEDLDVNMDVDLGNLERLFMDRVCTRFILCNGRYSSRRAEKKSIKNSAKSKDNNHIYVKVQLTLDDEMKNELVGAQSKLINLVLNKKNNNNGLARRNMFKDSYGNMTVTRTTARTTAKVAVSAHPSNATTLNVNINTV